MMDDKMMNEEQDVENVGIMQGFMDDMEDELEDEDKLEGEEEDAAAMERRPDSPEILMNNLRGDMRSIEARRDELADLVGYAAASETPEPVLAMLQPILAQGGGIGALPPSQAMAQGPQPPMAPPQGAAPGGMPPGAPPMVPGSEMAPPPDSGGIAALLAGAGGPPMPPGGAPPGGGAGMPPVGMAKGGPVVVQNFQAGSDEEGVSPANQSAPLYSPDMVTAAEAMSRELLGRRPAPTPSLDSLMQQRLPQYQKILGENANLSQAQLLFELGQRAFNFAGNVDDAGRPLRGGFFSRAAQASRTLPASMSKFITEADRQQRQLKLLAMQAAEKDIDQVTAANQALTREQRALAAEVVKGEARRKAEAAKALGVSMFGKGDWHWNVVNQPNLLARWASGQTNDTENGLIQSALVEMRRPTTYQGPDPNNPSQVITFTRPGEVPDFAKRFEVQRRQFEKTGKPAVSAVNAAPVDPSPGSPAAANVRPAPGTGDAAAAATAPVGAPLSAGGGQATPGGQGEGSAGAAATPSAPVIKPISLWRDRFYITGPVSGAMGAVSSIPGLGDPMEYVTKSRQDARLYSERLIEALLKSTAGSLKEQERLRNVIDIVPSLVADPDAYGTKLVSLGNAVRETIRENMDVYNNQRVKNEDRLVAIRKAQELQKIYNQLDLPPVVYTEQEAERMFRAGHPEVLWHGLTPIRQRQQGRK
jgi:hypothetical protein